MIYIWRGRGIWAIAIPSLMLIVPLMIIGMLHLPPESRPVLQWLIFSCGLIAGILTAALGFLWNRGGGRWTIDSASGLRYFDKSAKHSLYFIPMQYWGLFYCAVAVAIMALKH